VARSKRNTVLFLRDMGFPVPRQARVQWGQQARLAADAIGYPVVVKPDRGAKGAGVHARLTNASQVHHAVKAIGRLYEQNNPPVVVEEWVSGHDYRLLVVAGHFLSAVHRRPAQVRGDGLHSIAELVRIANEDPRRGDGVGSHLVRLQVGDTELAQLGAQGFDADTVLEVGHVAVLRGTANLATGGTLEVVTERVHPDNRALAMRVAEALGIEIIGLDVISPDIGASFLNGGLKIIEVNSGPGVQVPPAADGSGEEALAGKILDLLFPAERRRRVPIVTVTGGASALRVACAVSGGLAAADHSVGLASRDGLTVGGVPWARAADVDTRDPAFQLLRNHAVDAVVVERPYDVLDHWGVGSGGCDIAIVLEIADGAPPASLSGGPGTADRLARMLMDAARVASVVSVDSPACARLAVAAPADRLCVVSLRGWSETIERHVAEGARAVVFEMGREKGLRLITAEGAEKQEIVIDIDGDSQEREQLADRLLACAASFCLGYSPHKVLAGLKRA